MTATMNAALIHGVRDVRLADVPRPQPGPGELLLAVRAVGLCGSDLHYYLEGGIGSAQVRTPLILGHEFAAEIVDPQAAEYGFTSGQLVAVDPARSCGGCEWCLQGHPNLCPAVRFTGSPPDLQGALAEYVTARPEALFPVPVSFSPSDTALLEPLGVAIHAVDLSHLRPMEGVAVLGAGPIGLLILQVARAAGADPVFAVDPLPYRTVLAERLGADRTAQTHEPILEWTAGRGVDVVFEATNSALAPAQATAVARIGGRVLLAGIPSQEAFSLNASVMRRKGLTLKMVRRMKHTYPRAIGLVAGGRVQLDPLVTHRFPLKRAAEAFALQTSCGDGVIKIVIEL